MEQKEDLMLANTLMLQAIKAIEDVMGTQGLHAVLRSAGLGKFIDQPPANDLEPAINSTDYARLNSAIEDFYGRGGRGMLKRVGRASFQYGIQEQAALMGVAGVALKVLPKKQRIKVILNGIGGAVKKTNPKNEYYVDDRVDNIIAYCVPTCSVCYGRHADSPVCHLLVGSVAEAIKWATGEEMEVRETLCIAKGDPYCRIEVTLP